MSGPFTRLTGSPIGRTAFTDSGAPAGATYMVRAVKLESTPSGSYFNASQGIFYTSDASTAPANASVAQGGTATFGATASGATPSYQWQRDGSALSSATNSTLVVGNVQPANTGVYTVVTTNGGTAISESVILGVSTSSKVIGTGAEIAHGIYVASNGNTFDQVLPSGAAVAVTAESGKITRTPFVDLTDDIVQVEFSGAGTLSLVLDNPSGPATAVNYNQPSVIYMKGHAGIVITGANDTTNVSVFSVGPATAVNQSLFRSDVTYDGVADIAFIAISSTNGKFGGVRTANASYFATKGITGVYAPNVQFTGPVYIGDISAFDAAIPVLQLGSASVTQINGGDLLQVNGRSVKVSGITQLRFVDGVTSQGARLPAQANEARLEQNDTDVTAQIVVNPAP